MTSSEACVTDLSRACDVLQPALETVQTLLRRCPEAARRPCTVHNDFHWGQLRGRAQRLTILDLERCVLGDPWVDVATFATQLEILSARPDLAVSPAEAKGWSQSFLNAWELHTGQSID